MRLKMTVNGTDYVVDIEAEPEVRAVPAPIVIGGSPETVKERMLDAAKRMRIGNWILLLHVGDMPKDLAKHNIDLFTSKVMPALHGAWDGYEHRWWPKPVDRDEPAGVA